MELIIGGLFPEHVLLPSMVWPHIHDRGAEITLSELKYAACQLKNLVAPGPDRIANEVIKIMCHTHSDVLLSIYNKSVRQAVSRSFIFLFVEKSQARVAEKNNRNPSM